MIFQLANGLTDCAGGHAQMRCGGIHAAVLQHGGKNIDKFKFYAAGRFRRGGLCRLHRGRVGLDGGSKSCFWAGVRCAAGIERVLAPSVFGRFGFILFSPLLAEGF